MTESKIIIMSLGLWSLLILPSVIIPILIWSMVWKGFALWTAGTRKEKTWFIILFIVNTLGILEIIYLLTRKQTRPIRKAAVRKSKR